MSEKKTFVVPVTWEVYSTISVEAESLEEALAYVKQNSDDIPLCTETEYVDGSYRIEEDIACEEGSQNSPYTIGSVVVRVPDEFHREFKEDDYEM